MLISGKTEDALRDVSAIENQELSEQRSDNVLAGASLALSLLAGLAGLILLYASARLMGYFEIPGAPKEHESIGAALVFCLAMFCFVEAVRFYRFFARPQIRDRYYATRLRRKEAKVKI